MAIGLEMNQIRLALMDVSIRGAIPLKTALGAKTMMATDGQIQLLIGRLTQQEMLMHSRMTLLSGVTATGTVSAITQVEMTRMNVLENMALHQSIELVALMLMETDGLMLAIHSLPMELNGKTEMAIILETTQMETIPTLSQMIQASGKIPMVMDTATAQYL
jgi:phosphotransferase system IIB component